MPRVSKLHQESHAGSVIAGIAKHFVGREKYRIYGKEYSAAQLRAPFEAHLAAIHDVRMARIAFQVAVAKERALGKQATAFAKGVRNTVSSLFGATSYADFGWKVHKKPGSKTVSGKLAGARKSAATREARKTMGSRQRLKIKGTLETD